MSMFEPLAHLPPLLAYLTTFFIMVSNGAVNFPSSQLLFLFCGFISTYGTYSQTAFIFFGAVGNIVGNGIVYELVRRNSGHPLATIKKIPDHKRRHIEELIRRHGALYVFLGKMVPGIKVFIPIAAGLAKVSRFGLYTALTVSSFLWATVFTTLGRYFGDHASFTKYYLGVVLMFVLFGYYITYKNYPELFVSLTEKDATANKK